jgi:hypothetical protein
VVGYLRGDQFDNMTLDYPRTHQRETACRSRIFFFLSAM